MSFLPHHESDPQPAEVDALPDEEAIDAADVQERLDEDPEDADNQQEQGKGRLTQGSAFSACCR